MNLTLPVTYLFQGALGCLQSRTSIKSVASQQLMGTHSSSVAPLLVNVCIQLAAHEHCTP